MCNTHKRIYDQMNTFSFTSKYLGPGLTTWDWTTYMEVCPWKKRILPLLAATEDL